MNQEWIQSCNRFLLAQITSLEKPSNTGILLFPGLMQPCSNVCYLNRDIMQEMAINKIFCASIDPIGHGESYGCFRDITLNNLYQNIVDCVNFAKRQGIKSLYLFGQGIIGNLLSKYAKTDGFIKGVFLLNPVIISTELLIQLSECFSDVSNNSTIELNRDFLTKYKSLFYLAGVEMSNVELEMISCDLIGQIIYEKDIFNLTTLDNNKNNIIITSEDKYDYNNMMNKFKTLYSLHAYNDRVKIIQHITRTIKESGKE